MRRPSILPSVLVALIVSIGVGYIFSHRISPAAVLPTHETAFERIKRIGTIRCGYAVWAPLLIKDPNTGKFSGLFYDYVESLAKTLNLKVVWAEEVGYAEYTAALKNQRFDVMCSGLWTESSAAIAVDFTNPISFQTLHAYVRKGDTRFDNNLDAINSASVTLSTIDGEMSSIVAAADFPNAKTNQMPALTSPDQLLLDVIAHKADATITDDTTAMNYMTIHPNELEQVHSQNPVRVFGDVLGIAQNEEPLRRMLDIATQGLVYDGTIDKLIAKYEQYPGTLLRVAKSYEASKP